MLLFYSIFFMPMKKVLLQNHITYEPGIYRLHVGIAKDSCFGYSNGSNVVDLGSAVFGSLMPTNKIFLEYELDGYNQAYIGSLYSNNAKGLTRIDLSERLTHRTIYVIRLDNLNGMHYQSYNRMMFNEDDVGKTIPMYISQVRPSFSYNDFSEGGTS